MKTNASKGLSPVDLSAREAHFGSNKKEPTKLTSFYKLFLGALDDFMLKLLIVCAIVSISIEVAFAEPQDRSHGKFIHLNFIAWIEGFAILVAVFVVSFVGSWNDY